MNESYACSICGRENGENFVARLAWKSRRIVYSGGSSESMEMTLSDDPKKCNAVVCVSCIRGIKRIPFSKLPEVDVPF